jgi:predicted nucleotidyltransferase
VTRFAELLRVLAAAEVEFIVVGGVAATAHGSARSTQDVDVVYGRSQENLRRLAGALAPHRPYLRGAPPGLPFRFDAETLAAGLNFTLITDLGWLDLLGEITGGGRYEDLLQETIVVEVFGVECLIVELNALIRTKRSAGRPKDLETIAELETLRARREP